MSRKPPTYNQLATTTKELREATKITSRRAAAEKLVNFLSNASMRAKLAKESYDAAKSSNDPSPYNPLRKAYANAIRAALYATSQCLGSSKSKSAKQKADIVTPFKVLFAIDTDSDHAISVWKKERREGFDECEPFTFESFDRYRNTNEKFATHAGAKEIRELLQFLLEECLQREDCLSVAEVDLMQFLQKICARPDYVVHFHPRQDVIEILKAIKPRLEIDHSTSSQDSSLNSNAAKALYNLVHNMTVHLGIQMHAFVTPCLALVLDWVRDSRENGGYGHGILASMYGVAVDILSSYPEQCVSVLATDDMGKDLFSYARRCWGSARDVNRDTLIAYFSAHLYVCEVAGNLQGLLPGDLGDVKNASIDKQKLGFLMEMLLSKNSLDSISKVSETPSKKRKPTYSTKRSSSVGSRGVKKGRSNREQLEQFHPLSRRQRCFMELCARVIRCYQRVHLADSERNPRRSNDGGGGLNDKLIDECLERNLYQGLGSPGSLCDEDLSSSPWIQLIGRVCLAQMVEDELGTCSSLMTDDISPPQAANVDYSFFSHSQADSVMSQMQGTTDEAEMFAKLPMMKAILSGMMDGTMQQSLDDTHLVAYLQLISACAEVFPRGECWSSSNRWFKTNYSPFEDAKCSTFCNVCNSTDLASIIYCLSIILKRFGGADGNIKVQNWTMVCLLKLTEASHICCRYSTSNMNVPTELAIAWQCVWDRLLHSDLRYHSYTANASSSTAGELVLMLLTEIVRGGLTDTVFLMHESESQHSGFSHSKSPSFMKKHQAKIWNLPVFWSGSEVKSSSPFELAAAVIHSCGLVEGVEDAISMRQVDFAMEQRLKLESSKGRGRRFRLASFCLQFLSKAEEVGSFEHMRRFIPFITSLLCALLDGKIKVTSLSSYSLNSLRQLKITEYIHRATNRFKCRTDNSVEVLWIDSICPFSFQSDVESNHLIFDKLSGINSSSSCLDWSRSERSWLEGKFASLFDHSAAHSPLQTMIDVKDYTLDILLDIIEPKKFDEYLEHDAFEAKTMYLSSLCNTAACLKCIMVVALCGDSGQRSRSPFWPSIEVILHSLLRNIVSNTEKLSADTRDFPNILTEVVGIVRFMRHFISAEPNPRYMKNMLPMKLSRDVYKNFEGMVQKFVRNRDIQLVPVQSLPSSETTRSSSANFDSDEDDSNLLSSRKSGSEERSLSLSSESDDDTSRKRKSRVKHTENKRMRVGDKTRNESNAKIDSKTAYLCAMVMIILDPTLTTSTLIAETIIWPEGSCFEPDEPSDCLMCLGMINSFSCCQNDSTFSKDSNDSSSLSLCLDIVFRYRQISRTWSPFHMKGFGACATILKKRLSEREDTLSKEEIESLSKTLVPEEKGSIRSLNIRPSLRLSQLEATVQCFLASNDEFLKSFSDIFRSLVMTSLCDQNVKVRRCGIRALGVALTLFPFETQRIISKKALAQFPPKPSLSEEKRKGEKFIDWVETRIEGVNADMAEFEATAWHESRQVVEGDKIRAISVIGGMTKDSKVAELMVRHLVYVSIVPRHRTFTFLQLETLATNRKYKDMEEMLNGHEVHLLLNWFESGRALTKLPIILTSPSLVRSTLRMRTSDDEISDLLQGTAAEEYITKQIAFILPFAFIVHADIPQNEIERFLSSLKYLDTDSEEQTYLGSILLELAEPFGVPRLTILKSHFHDIYANLLPMLAFESEKGVFPFRQYANAVIKALSSLLRNAREHIKQNSDQIIEQLLNASVRKAISYDGFEIESKFYMQGINHVAEIVSGARETNQELFKCARTSATECLLTTRALLQKFDNDSYIDAAWGTIEAIAEAIQDDNDCNEIGFCILSLLSILVSSRSDGLRKQVLIRLSQMLDDVKRRNAETSRKWELSQVLNKLVSTITNVHEEYQTLFVDTCMDALVSSRRRMRMSKSFTGGGHEDAESSLQTLLYHLDEDFDETPNTAIGKFGNNVDKIVTECLGQAYTVLEMILNKNTSSGSIILEGDLHLVDPFPESKFNEFTLGALSSFQEEYSLEGLLQTFEDERNDKLGVDFQQKILGFIATSARFRAAKISAAISNPSSRDPSILPSEERSQLAALRHLIRDIEDRIEEEGAILEDIQVLDRLRRELFDLCDKQYEIEIRTTAAKCVGHLVSHSDLCCKGQNLLITNETHSQSANDPLPGIYASAFKLVAKCIQSDDIDTAITAKETAKNLFQTKDGSGIWKQMNEDKTFHTVLRPLAAVRRGVRNVPQMSDEFNIELLALVGKTDGDLMKGRSWCWIDQLWTFPSGKGMKYEDWIKYLVCSMILCCYINDNEGGGSIKGKSDFIPQCLGLCARKSYA